MTAGTPVRGSKNPERDQQFFVLWDQGWSARQIGDHLGFSRSTVIGAIARHHSSATRAAVPNHAVRSPARAPRAPVVRVKAPPRPPKPIKAPRLGAEPLPTIGLTNFLLHTHSECSFPMWDHYGPCPEIGELIVCGRPRAEGTSYCPAHAAVCETKYTRAPPKEHRGLA